MWSWGFLDIFCKSQDCLKNTPTKVFPLACRENSAPECLISMVKETSLSHHPGVALTIWAGAEAPSQLHPLHYSRTKFPHQLDSWFPTAESQTSRSLKHFNHGAITKQQVGLVLPRRDLKQRNLWSFIPYSLWVGKSRGPLLLPCPCASPGTGPHALIHSLRALSLSSTCSLYPKLSPLNVFPDIYSAQF